MMRTLIQYIVIVGSPLWIPLLVSWFHTWNVFSVKECTRGEGWEDHVKIFCQRKHWIGDGTFLIDSSSTNSNGASTAHGRQQPASIRIQRATAPTLLEWSEILSLLLSPTNDDTIFVPNDATDKDDPSTSTNPRITVTLTSIIKTGTSSTRATRYGFRRNTNQGNIPRPKQPVPIATAILLLLNLGVFFGLWNYRVDPSLVALNSQFNNNNVNYNRSTGRMFPSTANYNKDLGTALMGHLSHFDLWHVGFNMMTWASVGSSLERTNYFSSIPLLLWTFSFLPLTSLVVWGINSAMVMLIERGHAEGSTNTSTTNITATTSTPLCIPLSLPSLSSSSSSRMVGFSGILFAWMVIVTLWNGPGSTSCPIFFLPNFCFETFALFSTEGRASIYMNIGPLVQLVVLQLLLPRVSWLGHLAGIVVGFVWHWRLLPPLGVMQPCVLFPLLWIVGDVMGRHSNTTIPPTTETTTIAAGTRNGVVVQSHGDCWRRRRQDSTEISDSVSILMVGATRQMVVVRNLLGFHLVFGHAWALGLWTSSALSSLLILMILQHLIHQGENHHHGCDDRRQAFSVATRAYVGLSYVLILTDGLTLGIWVPTWYLWNNTGAAFMTILARDLILFISIGSIAMGTLERLEALQAGEVYGVENERKDQGTWYMTIYPIARCNILLGQSLRDVRIHNRIRLLTLPVKRAIFQNFSPRRNEDVGNDMIGGSLPIEEVTSHQQEKQEETIALV